MYNKHIILKEEIYMSTSEENKTNGYVVEISSKQSNFTKQGSNSGNNTMKVVTNIKNQQSNNQSNKE
jgi:hypothetical protein